MSCRVQFCHPYSHQKKEKIDFPKYLILILAFSLFNIFCHIFFKCLCFSSLGILCLWFDLFFHYLSIIKKIVSSIYTNSNVFEVVKKEKYNKVKIYLTSLSFGTLLNCSLNSQNFGFTCLIISMLPMCHFLYSPSHFTVNLSKNSIFFFSKNPKK